MDQILPKAKQWIKNKKDPRSAHWQAALHKVMDLFRADLVKGKLTPVGALEKKDLAVFNTALERVDLSPGLLAAFLPPSVADPIHPPDSMDELMRIEPGRPSYKIIIQRPGKDIRMLCAEISEYAHRPGVDIFQSGAFLGNFDYDTHDVCILELTKALRAHAWEKNKWQRPDYMVYTLNWFEKTIYLGKPDVSVDKDRSFFHTPTLLKMNRIDALFLVLYETLKQRFKQTPEPLPSENNDPISETVLLELLTQVKELGLLDFANFTNAESHQFQNEFARTVRKLSSDLEKMKLP